MIKLDKSLQDIIDRLGIKVRSMKERDELEPGWQYESHPMISGPEENSVTPAYSQSLDTIFLPDKLSYADATVAHELIHWTRTRDGREGRQESGICCDKHIYMLEELTAEIGGPLLCTLLDLDWERGRADIVLTYADYFSGPSSNLNPLQAFDLATQEAGRAVAYLLREPQQTAQAA